MEGELGLARGVDVSHLLGLHVALLMVDAGLNDAIPDGLQVPKGKKCHQKAYPLSPRTSHPISFLHSHTLTNVTHSLATSWLRCKAGTPCIGCANALPIPLLSQSPPTAVP